MDKSMNLDIVSSDIIDEGAVTNFSNSHLNSDCELSEEVQEHIEKSLDFIRGIFYRVARRAEELDSEETLPLTVLAAELAPEYGMTKQYLYPVIKMVVMDGVYPGFKFRTGAKGGLQKIINNKK